MLSVPPTALSHVSYPVLRPIPCVVSHTLIIVSGAMLTPWRSCPGRVTQQCQPTASISSIEAIKIAAVVCGILLFIAFGVAACLRWRQVIHDLSTARINRVKHR